MTTPEAAQIIKPQYRSGEELTMRGLIVPELRKRYPSARIIHELPLRYSTNRIDLAAVTETEIVSVEIKSSKDVPDRLEAQIRGFLSISSRIIVALAPKWNVKLPSITWQPVPGTTMSRPQYTEIQEIIRRAGGSAVETWTVDANAGTTEVTDSGYRNTMPWTARMLDILHVAELIEIAGRHRCWSGKRPAHRRLVMACFEMMTAREIIAAVCQALRERDAFAKESDPPVMRVGTPTAVPADQEVRLI